VPSRVASAFLLLLVASHASAQRGSIAAWAGTWQLDRSASHFVGFVVGIHHVAGSYRFDLEGTSIKVGDDGKDYVTAPTRTTSFTQLSRNEWVRTHKLNGKKLDESVFRLSPNAQSFTIHTVATDEQGIKHNSDETFVRQGGGAGLDGTWRSTSEGINVPKRLEIALAGRGLRFTYPAEQLAFNTPLDGTPVQYSGAHAVPSVRVALKRISSSELHRTDFLNGKPYQEETDMLAQDGKQLTAISWHVATPADRDIAVYRRQ
jgi:hypothetical protein